MIKEGNIVILDPDYPHPELQELKDADPLVFEAEGEVVRIGANYETEVNIQGESESVFVGYEAEVEWDDGEGPGTYPVEWLIDVNSFKPGTSNPNRTFRVECPHTNPENARINKIIEKIAAKMTSDDVEGIKKLIGEI